MPTFSHRQRRPRVLIVDDDPTMGLATMNECLKIGLEPKLCIGAEASSACPALEGKDCPRTRDIEATLLSITNGPQRQAAPACVGGRLLLSGEEPLIGHATRDLLHPDAVLEYPYDPRDAARMLFTLVMDERRRRLWDRIRETTELQDMPST